MALDNERAQMPTRKLHSPRIGGDGSELQCAMPFVRSSYEDGSKCYN